MSEWYLQYVSVGPRCVLRGILAACFRDRVSLPRSVFSWVTRGRGISGFRCGHDWLSGVSVYLVGASYVWEEN